MLLPALINTLALFGERKFRRLIWQSIAATFGTLIVLFYVLQFALSGLIVMADQWFNTGSTSWLHSALVFISSSGLLVALAFIMPTTLMVLAGFFTDAVSEIVEQQPFSILRQARPLSNLRLIGLTFKYIGIYMLCAVGFMLLLPFPLLNIIIPFIITSFVMAREYFTFAALRVVDDATLKVWTKEHKWALGFAGVIIHIIALTPFLNTLTPLLATGLAANLVQEAGQQHSPHPGA